MSFSGKSNATSTTIVQNDGWWPDLSVATFQQRYRLPRDYAEIVLVDGLQIAMAWANAQLAEWRATHPEALSLEEVDSPQLGGEPVALIHYRRAVFSYAKAYLLQQFPTINRRDAASNDALESEETEGTFLEYAQHALASMRGLSMVTVELI